MHCGDSECRNTHSQADDFKDDVFWGIQSYRTRLLQDLTAYRSQRAWKLMLFMRKAYTLLVKRGWHGRLEFLTWMFRDMLLGKSGLEHYDLMFPDIWSFIPKELIAADTFDRSFEVSESLESLVALSESTAHGYDVIMLPVFDFEFRFQRPQQLAVQFAAAGHRVFWISPSRMLSAEHPRAAEIHRIRKNIWEVNLRAPSLNLYSGTLTTSTLGIFTEALAEFWGRVAIAECCVFMQFPFWRKLGLALRERFGAKLLYDCMDDWQNWPTEPFIGEENLADERKLVQETDVLLVTSTVLSQRYAGASGKSILVPNAADFTFFQTATKEHPLSGNVRHPIIGYYGAISKWFDIEAVREIAHKRPEYSIVVIGQVHEVDVTPLKAFSNIHFLGEKHYSELPSYLRAFDVCLIPFVLSKLTNAVDPVKLYEYLSQGKPVVASRMPELLPFSNLLYLATTPDEFVSAVDAALAENTPECYKHRVEFASRNTWQRRYEDIDLAISASFGLVSIIIVTYNTVEFIEPLWTSLLRNTSYPNFEVIFVDNCSNDGTQEAIGRVAASDARVRSFLLSKNLGFAGGNNVAVKESRGEYVILLNPDTLLTRGWIERLVRPLRDRNLQVGMTAPVTNFSGNETRINTSYKSIWEMEAFAERLGRMHSGVLSDVAVIPLFCAALTRECWDKLGGLDERFEVGMFEDDDFSLRVQTSGYRTVCVENCFVHHFGNGSFGKLPSRKSIEIFERNRDRFELKWGRKWVPHRTRPGVKPPEPSDRTDVGNLLCDRPKCVNTDQPPLIRKVIPSYIDVGVGFNVQPDGNSAVLVECERATPDTTVIWDKERLSTTFASSHVVTASVPRSLYCSCKRIEITLSNTSGSSAPVVLEICDRNRIQTISTRATPTALDSV